jgi:hypothetical protein
MAGTSIDDWRLLSSRVTLPTTESPRERATEQAAPLVSIDNIRGCFIASAKIKVFARIIKRQRVPDEESAAEKMCCYERYG